jgi:hypothetical protein
MFSHYVETINYSIVLRRKIDFELDSVQLVAAFILIDAVSFEARGEKRGVPGVMSPVTDE